MEENKNIDKKSLKFLKGKNTDWDELAKDCVCFANSLGGFIYIGIEDNEKLPPETQKILDRNLPDVIQKNIAHRTVNVGVAVTIEEAKNSAEYIQVQVFRNAQTIASTTDGKYYARVHDECKPIPPDEMARLAADKNAFVWEEQTTKRVPSIQYDEQKRRNFLSEIRNSVRVSNFIKEMTDDEIMEFYFIQKNGCLTNLGILWIGKRNDRASLLYSPAIQVIRYDDKDEKVWKLLLDDYFLNPKELLERVLDDVPDWQETDERVAVIVKKQFVSKEVVRLMDKASSEFSLKQKEVISLGLLAQQQSFTALEISSILNQNEEVGLRNWLGRLSELELIIKTGKGKGTQYAVNPEFIRKINFKGKTNLKNIEDYRLEELVFKDLKAYPKSGFGEIHQRIGMEINQYKVKRMLRAMVEKRILDTSGETRGMKYHLR